MVVDEVRRSVERGEEMPRPADLFEALIERYIDVSHARLQELAQQVDRIEDQVLSRRADLERIGLGPIRRELSLQHREFLALRSALQRGLAARGGVERCGLEVVLPTLAQHVEDFDRDAAGLQALARLLHEEVEAQLASTANRSLRVLTVLTALLMPATLAVGAFGMNLQGIPYTRTRPGVLRSSAPCAPAWWGGCFLLLRRLMR
jgi:zinc transporter